MQVYMVKRLQLAREYSVQSKRLRGEAKYMQGEPGDAVHRVNLPLHSDARYPSRTYYRYRRRRPFSSLGSTEQGIQFRANLQEEGQPLQHRALNARKGREAPGPLRTFLEHNKPVQSNKRQGTNPIDFVDILRKSAED